MMIRFPILTAALLAPYLVFGQQQQFSHGNPSDAEQLMLEYINRARANPSAEGQRLVTSTDPDVINAINTFGVVISDVTNAFNSYQAVPPLAFNSQLLESADTHTEAMIVGDEQTHQFANGPNLRTRTNTAGYTAQSSLRENVYAYMENPWMGHAAFQIDWGNTPNGIQDPPGHRSAIMDFNNPDDPFTEIGIGIRPDTNTAGTTVLGPLVVTQDFGRPSNDVDYIVGVVYSDDDGDGFYSEGEGISGITITPDQGDFFAVTSSSGGYAIPMENVSGTVTVTASGSALGSNQSQQFTFNNQSVKLDFTTSGASVQNPPVDFGSDTQTFNNAAYITTAWFGSFFDLVVTNGANPGLLLHDQHGLMFYQGSESGMWWYSASLEWSWTSRAVYPFIYVNNIGWVYFFELDTQPRVFFDTTNGQNFLNDPNNSDDLFYF
ncbi:CAP domain-containing protein [Rubellicoccus peritrichatus]|uniref:CAP domain-containing protein n=1 Tax=Rubellicoccus peritrichatus TaxID=3080537 RepID=A0AAQ3QTX1_9BACT|nr:CAP domain-containing protein [Puniceicoccus sp. CR14]WOO39858.1 CAP domain-containing protein [Puniceicoccus sp. CR14]